MIRDATVTALLEHHMAPQGAVHRDAVRLLLTYCGAGMSDGEIGRTLAERSAAMSPELLKEIESVAAQVGIRLY